MPFGAEPGGFAIRSEFCVDVLTEAVDLGLVSDGCLLVVVVAFTELSQLASLLHGISRNAWPHASTSSQPEGTPRPATSPRSLMLPPSSSSSGEFAGISVFKST